jgi:tRNA pseudouridine55 synthase
MDGALVVDKQAGMTSHDVVAAVRRMLREPRIGHVGTLDPFATGVLVLLIGRATRLARFYSGRDKTYRGRIRFGFSTDTMDSTGQPAGPDASPVLKEESLREVFAAFVGVYEQRPPAFSAKKVSGVPAYRLARKGRSVELAPVPVTIHALQLTSAEGAFADFEATVSSGTYLRALVNDIGEQMGTGAHLVALRRTRLGEFGEREAHSVELICDMLDSGHCPILPLAQLLPEIPAVALTESQAGCVRHGRDLECELDAAHLRLLAPDGALCAIGERVAAGLYHPAIVFPLEHQTISGPPPHEGTIATSPGTC